MRSVPVLGWATDGLSFARTLERDIATESDRGRRPDVIDAHFEYPDGVGAWLAGRRCGIPVVVTIRGKIVSLSRKTLRRMQIAWMLRGVSARIAVSRSLAEWTRRIGGSDLDVHVIPNGVDRAVFHPVPLAQARQSLHWDPSATYILAVGHQQYVKGFDRLLAAARVLRHGDPNVRFILAGSSRGEKWFRTGLRTLASDCNKGSSAEAPLVAFTDSVPPHALNLMYNAADLMVNVSRSEGWCNAITEALACGTPVLATDVGGNREQVCSLELGRIIENAEPESLANAIVDALKTIWNRHAISAIGSQCTWSQTAHEAYAVLADAISLKTSSTCIEVAGAIS